MSSVIVVPTVIESVGYVDGSVQVFGLVKTRTGGKRCLASHVPLLMSGKRGLMNLRGGARLLANLGVFFKMSRADASPFWHHLQVAPG